MSKYKRGLGWRTGNWSSSPEDSRCYLEASERTNAEGKTEKVWRVYRTDKRGSVLKNFPRQTKLKFEKLEDAQKWVEDNVAPRD